MDEKELQDIIKLLQEALGEGTKVQTLEEYLAEKASEEGKGEIKH